MTSLPDKAFERFDESPDEEFYRQPRFVTRIDEAPIAVVTALYRRSSPPGSAILALMSGWVSLLPPEVDYARVVGIGMKARELAENPSLDEFHVQNPNRDPRLPFADGVFDGEGEAGVAIEVL